LERLRHDVAGLKDDMTIVMARLDRLDATTRSLATKVPAMHSRHDRVAKRVERLEEASREVPSAANIGLRTSRRGHSRKPPDPDVAIAHKTTQAVDAVLQSIAERCWVRIDEV
jgi:hypothetical protein